VRLRRDADVAANIAAAMAAGTVSEVALEPPALDEIFTELVGDTTTSELAAAPEDTS
jgi:hypothetical protein